MPTRLSTPFKHLSLVILLFTVACAAHSGTLPPPVDAPGGVDRPVGALPNHDGDLKFAVIGDMGVGTRPQYDVAQQMEAQRQRFPFNIVLMVGDNLYGPERPADYASKFERPYAPLLSAGVKFYASLGNHDEREQRMYKNFNMDGEYYYSMKAPTEDVRFFFLESTYPDETQLKWMDEQMGSAKEKWKIAVFHHPLYSSGGRHGSNVPLRNAWEPLFVRHNISVVFAGHEHFYERIKPQKGILYFTTGAAGKLSPGDIRDGSPLTAAGFDSDQSFMLVEIDDDVMFFQSVSRTGRVVDSGSFTRRFTADEKTPEPAVVAR
jgi:hypothetical protein